MRQPVADDLLGSFETIAIEILSQEDESLSLLTDERIKASIIDPEPQASVLLRHGVSETVAILGSGFGHAANLPRARERADGIVRATLQEATWLKWTTLGDLLPLLAEASPREFLAAINADLKGERPELAKVLADDAGDHPLMSRCKHAGLLWALEVLAWSPELLPTVCTILGTLDEVDCGHKWGNRPAHSLREILLCLASANGRGS